jgi:hypothetical protein
MLLLSLTTFLFRSPNLWSQVFVFGPNDGQKRQPKASAIVGRVTVANCSANENGPVLRSRSGI